MLQCNLLFLAKPFKTQHTSCIQHARPLAKHHSPKPRSQFKSPINIISASAKSKTFSEYFHHRNSNNTKQNEFSRRNHYLPFGHCPIVLRSHVLSAPSPSQPVGRYWSPECAISSFRHCQGTSSSISLITEPSWLWPRRRFDEVQARVAQFCLQQVHDS